ncbi:protein of unknown function (plasmid) [Escherichia coli]|nr:protein of unknown function [Escherichia coli]
MQLTFVDSIDDMLVQGKKLRNMFNRQDFE